MDQFGAGKVNIATVASKHLVSPREDNIVDEAATGAGDAQNAWMIAEKNVRSNADLNNNIDASNSAAAS